MEKNMFEVGADIDVEALMARIREAAQSRRRSTPQCSANPLADGRPQTIEVGNLLQEIDRSGPFADAINQIPLKSSGWKRRLEFRVKRFLKYLVHWNTKAQADFNRSAMRSLGLVAQDLQSIQRSLSLIEKQMREAEQSGSTKMDEEVGIIAAALEELNRNADELAATLDASSSELQQKINLISSKLHQKADALAATLDANSSELQQKIDLISSELYRKADALAASSSGLEQKINLITSELHGKADADALAANSSELQQKIDLISSELYRKADALAASSSGLEQKINLITSELHGKADADALAANSSALEQKINLISSELQGKADADALAATLDANSSALEQKINLISSDLEQNLAQLRDEMGRNAQQTVQGVDEKVIRINHEFDEMRMRIIRAERSVRRVSEAGDALPATVKSNRETRAKNPNHLSQAQTAGKSCDQAFDYFLFEHQFRGPVAEIKRRQSAYLELFRGRENVLDLGCGRGEFVELLSENNINVKGVDNNEDMVEFCSDRGLRVVLADVFDYLSDLLDASLDGISILQLVEHLTFRRILSLISLCEQKLMSGGILVAETINTNCPTALGNFYLDPTHIRPVPAQMLRFLLGQGTLNVQSLRFSSPIAGNVSETSEVLTLGLPQEMNLYQDYAVVAIKL
jgi:2-polyprenyl-3-methyl-5-hydroxy-6-metoxy-1,4-benzoquinol methylase